MPKTRLTGTWELVSCRHLFEDGSVEQPLGPDPLGRLVYTDDGRMIVMLMDRRRARFKSPGLFEGAARELAAAGRGFIAYSGRYEIKADSVVHRVDMSYFPNWIGTSQTRGFVLKDGTITFSTRPYESRGRRQRAVLVWRRARR